MDEDLQRLRERRMLELQAQQQQTEEVRRAQEEAESRKQTLLRRILSPEARQRLTNIKMVKPDYANQMEVQLIQLAQSGRIQLPITDEMLRKLLVQIEKQQRREITIRRK
jgi:programmed cell death protein 5